MNRQIYVNLPIRDMERSKAFFTSLGFSFNPQFTNDQGACMVIGKDSFVMLLVESFFRGFTTKPVADATKAYLEALREAGEIRKDVDAQKLCTAAISMIAFPLLEASFLSAVWPLDPTSKKYLEGTRDDIVEMLVRRLLP